MIDTNIEPEWTLFDDDRAVAERSASTILELAARAIADKGEFRLVLAGGRTPHRTYRLLADADAQWERWKILYGDERCLPAGHAQRNSTAADELWLSRVAILKSNLFAVPAELGPQAAAEKYAATVSRYLPFDLVLLGLGEDGHTASLFPGQAEPEGVLVMPVFAAPKPPPKRVSLTARALGASDFVLIQVTGQAKRDALARWRAGESLPVARIGAMRKLQVLIDRAAAGA